MPALRRQHRDAPQTGELEGFGASLGLATALGASALAKIDVKHHAKCGDRTQQAKQHIEATLHAQGFSYTDASRDQAAENCKTENRLGTGSGLRLGLHCFSLCAHKVPLIFDAGSSSNK